MKILLLEEDIKDILLPLTDDHIPMRVDTYTTEVINYITITIGANMIYHIDYKPIIFDPKYYIDELYRIEDYLKLKYYTLSNILDHSYSRYLSVYDFIKSNTEARGYTYHVEFKFSQSKLEYPLVKFA